MNDYLQTVEAVYAEAAKTPDAELCCTQSPVWRLPDLKIPERMLAMNYGCGSTVHPRDIHEGATVLYVGVGGGLEALQFAYLTRRPGSVLAVDPVAEMREQARINLEEAARLNSWFQTDFVRLLDGDAFHLPAENNSVSVVAQNCLFNIFTTGDLQRALGEVFRVLRIGGLFSTCDPVTPVPLPESLADDERLRARCISGCLTIDAYLGALTDAGFGRIEVRSRSPYRYLHPREYPLLKEPILLESIEAAAYKVPDGFDGPEILTGRTAIYFGDQPSFTDQSGTVLRRGIPQEVSDAAAARLQKHPDIFLTPSTWHSKGTACC
ncbi:MAG: methyltransferase type 11 [Gemmatales bacterium]|nr:MAG: methyltransferase type 11 [Gemmatales bacterium]